MISEQARSGFDYIFRKAITANVVISSDDNCEIEIISDLQEINENEFVVLTISSASFRFFTLFHFNSNTETESYFTKSSEFTSEAGEKNSFRDALLEFCNMCCGFVVRELHKNYHFLGMSTPYVLVKRCSTFISELNPGVVKHYRITINHSVILHVTLCICDYDIVNFKVDTTEIEDDSTGELELF